MNRSDFDDLRAWTAQILKARDEAFMEALDND